MRIVLFTAAGAHNLGDELILSSEFDYLREQFPGAHISVASYSPPLVDIPWFHYFPAHFRRHPLKNLWFLIRNIYEIACANIVIFGGGGLLYDNESGQSFDWQLSQWKWRARIARFFRVRILWWSVGIDVSPENTSKLVPLFEGKNTAISVRDHHSSEILTSLQIAHTLVRDPVFLASPLKALPRPKTRPKVGLALRGGYLPDETQTIDRMIRGLQVRGYEVVLLHHSFHPSHPLVNDATLLANIPAAQLCTESRSLSETQELYPQLRFVVAMRLHAMILSAVHQIPFIALSYSRKTDEVLDLLEYPHRIATKDLDLDTFWIVFEEIERREKELALAFKSKLDTIRHDISSSLNHLLYGLSVTHRKSKRSR